MKKIILLLSATILLTGSCAFATLLDYTNIRPYNSPLNPRTTNVLNTTTINQRTTNTLNKATINPITKNTLNKATINPRLSNSPQILSIPKPTTAINTRQNTRYINNIGYYNTGYYYTPQVYTTTQYMPYTTRRTYINNGNGISGTFTEERIYNVPTTQTYYYGNQKPTRFLSW